MQKKSITYLSHAGLKQFPDCLAATVERIAELEIKHAVVATTSGRSALELSQAISKAGLSTQVIGVGYAQNYADKWGHLNPELTKEAEKLGAVFLRSGHAMGGINSGIGDKFGTLSPGKLIASTYYTIGHGFKVAVEVALMAADACAIPLQDEIVTLGGAGKGADTALIVEPKCSAEFFDFRIREIICMPRKDREK
jgi:uncharacterized protein